MKGCLYAGIMYISSYRRPLFKENSKNEVCFMARLESACQNCSAPVAAGAVFCEKCGAPAASGPQDKQSAGINILSFLIPLIGIGLFFV